MQHGNSATILVNHHIKLLLNFLAANILSVTGPFSCSQPGQHFVSTVMAAAVSAVLLSIVTPVPVWFYYVAIGTAATTTTLTSIGETHR